MSRIGKKPVHVPAGVKVKIADRTVTVEGPLGKLQWEHRPEISVAYDEPAKRVDVTRRDDERQSRALHGLTRALLANMVVGVTQGYEKRLEIQASATWPPCRDKRCSFASDWPTSCRCRFPRA